MMKIARTITFSFALGGCVATAGSSGAPASGPVRTTGSVQGRQWPIEVHEHVDLWLHGYALLSRDTASVPLFERGYRERIQALKARRNIFTQLDANRDRLAARIATNPSLVNGQFVPLYFTTFEELQQIVAEFLRAQGDPRASNDPVTQQYFALLAGAYPTAADRDWLRLFVQSLADERARFFHDYWTAEQNARAPVRVALDSLWQSVYRPKLQRFLNNTQQANGEFVLSLPLDGEGRTVAGNKQANMIATGFPESAAAAVDAVYVFAHEAIGIVTGPAIADNITPAQQRSGVAAAYAANASVRGGALLLQRTAPELLQGYMRYYLHAAGAAAGAELSASFAARFPLPDSMRAAIASQLDLVLGGI